MPYVSYLLSLFMVFVFLNTGYGEKYYESLITSEIDGSMFFDPRDDKILAHTPERLTVIYENREKGTATLRANLNENNTADKSAKATAKKTSKTAPETANCTDNLSEAVITNKCGIYKINKTLINNRFREITHKNTRRRTFANQKQLDPVEIPKECDIICLKIFIVCEGYYKRFQSIIASVQKMNEFGKLQHLCTATLMSDYSLLTTATCVDCRELGAYAGEYVVMGGDFVPQQIADVIVNPNARGFAYNDVAILKLVKPYSVSYYARNPIGWGKRRAQLGDGCIILFHNSIDANDVHIRRVDRVYGKCRYFENTIPNASLMCMNAFNNCGPAYGSPLICNEELVGLQVLNHKDECQSLTPLYADVTKFRQWFEDNTPNRRLSGVCISANILTIFLLLIFIYSYSFVVQ